MGAIAVSDHIEDQFLSSLFIVKKKDRGNLPVANLLDFLKMEGFFLLKEMLLPGDKMCQIDLKYTYFAISLEIQEVSQISVENPSIRFLLLSLLRAFSSSSGLYKVLKSPYLSLEKTQCKNNNLP